MNDFLDEDFFRMFLEESREMIELLSRSLDEIQHGGVSNAKAIDNAFRAAHSVKGMAATMGFQNLVVLTHALEESVEGLRASESGNVETDLLAALFEASDAMAVLVETIAETRQDDCDFLADVLAGLTKQQNNDSSIWEVRLAVSERSLMGAARMFAAYHSLERIARIEKSEPSISDLEDGTWEGKQAIVQISGKQITADVIKNSCRVPEIEVVSIEAIKDVSGGTARPDLKVVDGDGFGAHIVDAKPMADDGRERRNPANQRQMVRIDASRLDDLMHGMGELLIHRSKLKAIGLRIGDGDLVEAISLLERSARDLQDMLMDVRMVRIEAIFRMLPRLVRDLERSLGKKVNLKISGNETELDRTVIEALSDPLIHIVRNAMDHGIESQDERISKGKSSDGLLDISASAEGGAVVVKVRDDGRGMSPEVMRRVAVARGAVTREEADNMSDSDAIDLCFLPGLSSRETASEISGRGVGLDAVKSRIRELGGKINLETSDEGTVITMRLPLTLAIRNVLLVRAGSEIYGLHVDRVAQTFDINSRQIRSVGGREAFLFNDTAIPIVDLAKVVGIDGELHGNEAALVVLNGDGGSACLKVDGILGQQEVVARAMPGAVDSNSLLSSNAVLGDGSIALLVNVDSLVSIAVDQARSAA